MTTHNIRVIKTIEVYMYISVDSEDKNDAKEIARKNAEEDIKELEASEVWFVDYISNDIEYIN